MNHCSMYNALTWHCICGAFSIAVISIGGVYCTVTLRKRQRADATGQQRYAKILRDVSRHSSPLLQVDGNAKRKSPCLCESWQQARKFSGLKRLLTAIGYKLDSRQEAFGSATSRAHLLQSSNDSGAACRSWHASVAIWAAVSVV